MKFEEILPGLRAGKVYRREPHLFPIRLKDGHFQFLKRDGMWTTEDRVDINLLLADTWAEYSETFDFSEALKRLKAGKKVSCHWIQEEDADSYFYLDSSSNTIRYHPEKDWDENDMWNDEMILSDDFFEVD